MSYLTDHAEDLFRRSEFEITHTSFLTPAEQREVFDALPSARERLVFWGGALGAQRRCAFFIPDWMLDAARSARASAVPSEKEGAEVEFARSLSPLGAFSDERELAAASLDADGSLSSGEIALVRIEGSGFASLGHRDFMGAILNLGIRRETLGDVVVVGECACEAYCAPAAASLVGSELCRVGRDSVRVSVGEVEPGARIERRYEELSVNVASARLDCVVGEIAAASREAAKRLIASGAVEVDYREETDPDARVPEGATLSVRGVGKFRVGETLGETRKGRLRLRIYRYV